MIELETSFQHLRTSACQKSSEKSGGNLLNDSSCEMNFEQGTGADTSMNEKYITNWNVIAFLF